MLTEGPVHVILEFREIYKSHENTNKTKFREIS